MHPRAVTLARGAPPGGVLTPAPAEGRFGVSRFRVTKPGLCKHLCAGFYVNTSLCDLFLTGSECTPPSGTTKRLGIVSMVFRPSSRAGGTGLAEGAQSCQGPVPLASGGCRQVREPPEAEEGQPGALAGQSWSSRGPGQEYCAPGMETLYFLGDSKNIPKGLPQ